MKIEKVLFYATIASGVVAAYLMYRRGENPIKIVGKTLNNPVGSLVGELKQAS